MSGVELHHSTIHDIARGAAIESGAIKPCWAHDHMLIRVENPDAERRAYAFATVATRNASMYGSRSQVMAAVKDVIETAAHSCPLCAMHEAA